ncbi:MAG: glycosyltransferase family 4 protein [Clostridiaceae bacterium]|nr:glycosyltransferase family 4 protein [Clostridiaceae bacterium]
MRILHGMVEVAGQNYYSVKGLKKLGLKADSAVWRSNTFGYPVEYDLSIGNNKFLYPFYLLKMIWFFLLAMFRYDCFHFHFGRSLLPLNLDLFILKLFKKTIFFEYHGSELRGAICNIPYEYFMPDSTNPRKQRLFKRMAKYADGFILHDAELIPHLPEGNVPVHLVPLRVDLELFTTDKKTTNSVPKIVHAPSKRSRKGTNYLLEALKKIELQYELILVENKTQAEALEIYQEADIVFDQISVGTYGVFAIEAMALGKPVLTYISDEMKEKLPDSLPIISVTPYNLKTEIETLLVNSDLRREIGDKGREYVREFHDYRKNAKLLKDIYTREKIND